MWLVYKNDSEERKRGVVMSIYAWEKDMEDHEMTLARYKKILEDESFVGRVFKDGSTFRQKIESEIPVLEGAIAECQKLIDTTKDMLPTDAEIQGIVQEEIILRKQQRKQSNNLDS